MRLAPIIEEKIAVKVNSFESKPAERPCAHGKNHGMSSFEIYVLLERDQGSCDSVSDFPLPFLLWSPNQYGSFVLCSETLIISSYESCGWPSHKFIQT